jgi:hypothetical protein
MEYRKVYFIIPALKKDELNFDNLLNTDFNDCTKNNQNTKFIVNLISENAGKISLPEGAEGPFSHEQMLDFITDPQWKTEESSDKV